ncbi:TATA box-binding protein-associated factor RNA polymerase I subunit A isoform X3 [Syngnathus acus]|uniref:TATA box-binding protein-associated factor RNA polymerase I subunit A isoform X3 n=1 Tax=Syngnathus acus TaxID=161584 RepID=UPI0018864D1A|nr:TATA box-binding protein-associated factor RNA polymerase I subunit A isoform X3 [Syngnathus acus]
MDDLENELWYPVQSPVLFDEHNDSSENTVTKKQKESELPLAEAFVVETAKETGFHRTTRLCLERIREAMLHHRWQEAAEYMACYPQQLEDTTAGPGKHYKEICLEHSFHLLLHGQIENANRHLSIAESWRHGQETAHQYQRSKLIQAYSGLLDYIIWCNKKNAPTKTSSTNVGSNQDMHYDFRQASVNLKEILKYPGVWDPFILSYVEMLEFYDAHDEAKKVLEEYAFDSMFPSNPNAHVYLYQYLQRHNAPARRLMKVLKVLHYLVPSHELMLDYSSFLLLSEKPGDIKKALGVLLDMLDYACWRTSMDAWKCLKDVIDKLQLQDDWKEVVAEQMTARKEWWPAMHFTMFHASEDAVQRPQLMEVKASLTKILCPVPPHLLDIEVQKKTQTAVCTQSLAWLAPVDL